MTIIQKYKAKYRKRRKTESEVYDYETTVVNYFDVLVHFEPSCDAYLNTNFVLIQHCLEWCEQDCANITKQINAGLTYLFYPFTYISCGQVGLACDDKIDCNCTYANGIRCSMKERISNLPTVQEAVDKYNTMCLNCNRTKSMCTWNEVVGSISTSGGDFDSTTIPLPSTTTYKNG